MEKPKKRNYKEYIKESNIKKEEPKQKIRLKILKKKPIK